MTPLRMPLWNTLELGADRNETKRPRGSDL